MEDSNASYSYAKSKDATKELKKRLSYITTKEPKNNRFSNILAQPAIKALTFKSKHDFRAKLEGLLTVSKEMNRSVFF